MLHDRNMFHRIAPKYHVPRAQRASPEMREMLDKPCAFRPIIPGHFDRPCDSPRARMSPQPKPKSQASSRASSRASGVNLNWLGDFMTKFVDDATSREKRDLDFMKALIREKDQASRERERLSFEMAREREKEIRDDMRQLAASEALPYSNNFMHKLVCRPMPGVKSLKSHDVLISVIIHLDPGSLCGHHHRNLPMIVLRCQLAPLQIVCLMLSHHYRHH